jgi:hypothetical protein
MTKPHIKIGCIRYLAKHVRREVVRPVFPELMAVRYPG